MQSRLNAGPWHHKQHGMTLFMVAACLFILLGMAALAIDLVSLYVARSEAQRAADSAALAAAQKLVEAGLLNGTVTSAAAQVAARQEAQDVGGENLVGGQAAAIADNDVVFDFAVANNPRVSVRVQRTNIAGNPGPMPTFFAKAIGFNTVDVSAVATAEAYTTGNGGPAVCTACLKPWIMPNCDPLHDTGDTSPYCSTDRYVDDPPSGDGDVINPGPYPTGVVGQQITVKPGDPHLAPVPSHFYALDMAAGPTEMCPDCAKNGGGGASLYRENISCCNTNQFYCGQSVDIDNKTGNMQGPTEQGVQCLIHQNTNGNSFPNGQDYLLNASVTPFTQTIIGGTNHPIPAMQGEEISTSVSLVTVPIYDGHPLCPGKSCGSSVTIVGFLQLFIERVVTQNGGGFSKGDVVARIIHVSGCGGGGGAASCGSGSGTIGAGGTPIPVRLIRIPDNTSFP